MEVLKVFFYLVVYYIAALALFALLAKLFKLPSEVVRKAFHLTFAFSVYVIINLSQNWQIAVGVSTLFITIAYLALSFLERFNIYQGFLAERSDGEIKNSLFLANFMMIALFIVFWGLLGQKWKVITPIALMAWGFGDAAAALVGKSIGKRKLNLPGVDKNKTLEGTLAMIITTALAVFLTSLIYKALSWQFSLVLALIVAPVAAGVELISHKGIDTVTVPLSTAASAFLVIFLMGLFGG